MRLLTAAFVVSLATTAHAVDAAERRHFDVNRAEFFLALKENVPTVNLPSLRCGESLLLRACWGESRNGVRYRATDSYTEEEGTDAFYYGSLGRLYETNVTFSRADQNTTAYFEFNTICAAMLHTIGAAATVGQGLDHILDGVEAALEKGLYEDTFDAAFFRVEADGEKIICGIAAQR